VNRCPQRFLRRGGGVSAAGGRSPRRAPFRAESAVLHVEVDRDDVGVDMVEEGDEGLENRRLAYAAGGMNYVGRPPAAAHPASAQSFRLVDPKPQELLVSRTVKRELPLQIKGGSDGWATVEVAVGPHNELRLLLHIRRGELQRVQDLPGGFHELLGGRKDLKRRGGSGSRRGGDSGGEGPAAKPQNPDAEEECLRTKTKKQGVRQSVGYHGNGS